ncbi:MAG: winged helix-turn-helix transcriptional regulator [Mobilitalea sp.]
MAIEDYGLSGIDLNQTGFGYTLSLINGKYKMMIMYWFAEYQPIMRYGQIKRAIGSISHKSLSNTLKELEVDHLIIRNVYPQIPPKVEYSLSERGKSLIPVLDMMCEWGSSNRI